MAELHEHVDPSPILGDASASPAIAACHVPSSCDTDTSAHGHTARARGRLIGDHELELGAHGEPPRQRDARRAARTGPLVVAHAVAAELALNALVPRSSSRNLARATSSGAVSPAAYRTPASPPTSSRGAARQVNVVPARSADVAEHREQRGRRQQVDAVR